MKNRIQEHTPISIKYEMKGRINTLSETVFLKQSHDKYNYSNLRIKIHKMNTKHIRKIN